MSFCIATLTGYTSFVCFCHLYCDNLTVICQVLYSCFFVTLTAVVFSNVLIVTQTAVCWGFFFGGYVRTSEKILLSKVFPLCLDNAPTHKKKPHAHTHTRNVSLTKKEVFSSKKKKKRASSAKVHVTWCHDRHIRLSMWCPTTVTSGCPHCPRRRCSSPTRWGWPPPRRTRCRCNCR